MPFDIMKVYTDGSSARSQTHDTFAEAQAGLDIIAARYTSLLDRGDKFVEVKNDDSIFRFEIVVQE